MGSSRFLLDFCEKGLKRAEAEAWCKENRWTYKIIARPAHYEAETTAHVTTATKRPGDEAAIMHEETGIPYERCLVMCNMD